MAKHEKTSAEFILLLGDHGDHKVGRVLRSDPDLLSALDVEGVKYRPATQFEISLGTIPGH